MTVPTLETPRLILRSVVQEDRKALVALLSDSEAMEHMHYKSWSVEQCEEWFDTAIANTRISQPEGLLWVIERNESSEAIGYVGIGNPADPPNAFDINFGYALARDHWNQGYMTEVLKAIFGFEFGTLGVPQLSANCRAPNIGSARAMEKAGMSRTHSDHGADFEGNWSHRHHYLITQDDWRSAAS